MVGISQEGVGVGGCFAIEVVEVYSTMVNFECFVGGLFSPDGFLLAHFPVM